MRLWSLLLACILALLPLGGAVRAQAPPLMPAPTQAPPPQARTLAQALAAVETPRQDLFLTVGADKITLPPNAPPPDPDSRPGSVGDAYGRLVRDFGGVMALAPPTRVVLNTRPGVPNPYDGIPGAEALKLLLAGLAPAQWEALTGENGLGASDLTDDSQRGLFRAILPLEDVTASREYTHLVPTHSWEPITLAARDIESARLRLGRRMQIDVPMVGVGNTGGTSLNPLVSGMAVYNAESAPAGMVSGAVLRQVLTNNPKDADLNYDAPALKGSIRVDGIATVGDLVARVGRAAGLELYADRRYETRRVMLIGRRTARGVDLLRALAFCLTGTYRKVGPAYVLTDDLQGTATRRQRLARFVQEGELGRRAALDAAGNSLITAHGGTNSLPWLGGLGFSDAQKALPQFHDDWRASLTVPFALLTPAQQEFTQSYSSLDRDRPFTLHMGTRLLLLSPAAPGPIFLSYLSLDQLFQPSFASQVAAGRRQAEEEANRNLPPWPRPLPPLSPPALAALLAPIPRRAVLAAPRTAAEVDSVAASMKALGLNQLWLDVFSGGHAHLDKPPGGGPDILTEALARTKGTGIAVVPALDLLRWGADAPAAALDRTPLGETSDQAEAWQQHQSDVTMDLPASRIYSPPAAPWVCPAAPATAQTLRALVRRLASTPGITTLALRDTVPPSYNHPPGSHLGVGAADLGYVPALRLGLLRRDHLDPVDLNWDYGLSLPEFDDPRWGDPWPATSGAAQDWDRLRDAASRDFLRRLLTAAQEAGGRRVRFLVASRGDVTAPDWYGLWDNPQAPLPEIPDTPPGVRPLTETDYAQAAHSRCRIALYTLPFWAASSQYIVADKLPAIALGWDGVVLDLTGSGVSGGNPLTALARGVAPAPPKSERDRR